MRRLWSLCNCKEEFRGDIAGSWADVYIIELGVYGDVLRFALFDLVGTRRLSNLGILAVKLRGMY